MSEVTAAFPDTDGTAASSRRLREFRCLLTGSSVSMLGSRVSSIGYPLLVLALTGSPATAGLACFAATAPSVLFYLPAGALVDRWNPRRAMLICESLRGAAIASVVLVYVFGHLGVIQLILVAIIEEIFEVFSTLAERRIARSLVDPRDAASALAQSEARAHLVVLLGRPIGAVLFGIERILPFIADALTFLFCIGAVRRIRSQPSDYSESRETHDLRREIGEGFGWLRNNPFARRCLWLTAGTTLIFQALIIIFLGVAHQQHLPSAEIGIVLAASGLGGVLGSAFASQLFRWLGYSLFKTQLLAWVVIFATLALLGSGHAIWPAIAMAILGFTGALGNIALDTYIIQNAAESMLARVLSVGRLTSFGALTLGPLAGGILVKEYSAQIGICILLVAAFGLCAAAPTRPSVRPRDRLDLPPLEYQASTAVGGYAMTGEHAVGQG